MGRRKVVLNFRVFGGPYFRVFSVFRELVLHRHGLVRLISRQAHPVASPALSDR